MIPILGNTGSSSVSERERLLGRRQDRLSLFDTFHNLHSRTDHPGHITEVPRHDQGVVRTSEFLKGFHVAFRHLQIHGVHAALFVRVSIPTIDTVSIPRIPGYAEGGFPQKSSLFFAGERGKPELLGTVGGQTAVAGGHEITGIRNAVYSTGQEEAKLLIRAIDAIDKLSQIVERKSLSIDSREIVTAYDNRKRRNGFSFT